MTSGMKTSEFWAVVIGGVLFALNNLLKLGLSDETINALAIAIAGYAISRGVAKQRKGEP